MQQECDLELNREWQSKMYYKLKCRVCGRDCYSIMKDDNIHFACSLQEIDQLMLDIDNPDFIEWLKNCVCDFNSNNNTHSESCKARFENNVIKRNQMMSVTLNENTCAKCFHQRSNHEGTSICNGDITCLCEKFVEPVLEKFAMEIEMQKQKLKSVYDRCKYILEKIPQTRNAGEKSFAKIYREIWYGFKIRKDGTKLTTQEWKRMKHDDTINRQKRQVKVDHPELSTYDKEVLYHQTALYQAIVEIATHQ